MARRAFFSFHYERDIWRASVVRKSWVIQGRESAGYFDASIWESAKTKGDKAVKALIDEALANTSVTVVLIGQYTASRSYVKYEIEKSIERGNGLLGVYVHKIATQKGSVDLQGANPLPAKYPVYAWKRDEGSKNLGAWIEKAKAAKAAGK